MKKKIGKKKSKSYAMKGGSGPYLYQGDLLTIDNPLTHIAVNEVDGTYNFNILDKRTGLFTEFSRFCELYQYYKENSPISCVHQQFIGNTGSFMKAPSFVDILGISLILRNIKNVHGGVVKVDDELMTVAFNNLRVIVNFGLGQPLCVEQFGTLHINNLLKQKILDKIIEKQLPSFDINNIAPIPINSLDKFNIDAVLRFFKQAIFYYRYGVINLDANGLLTFESMSTPEKSKILLTGNPALEQFKINEKRGNWVSKIGLYTGGPLKLALEIKEGAAAAGPALEKAQTFLELPKSPFEEAVANLRPVADKMIKLGAVRSDDGLVFLPEDTDEKKELREKFVILRNIAIELQPVEIRRPLGGRRGRTGVKGKITNKNRRTRRMRRTRRTRRRH